MIKRCLIVVVGSDGGGASGGLHLKSNLGYVASSQTHQPHVCVLVDIKHFLVSPVTQLS